MIQTFCLLASLSSAFVGQFAFDPPAASAVGNQPEGVVLADLDGDGELDMAVASDLPDKVSILFNDGVGGFAAPVVIATGGGTSPHALAAGDLDGDGDTDLAVTLKNVNQVRVLRNDGGTFVNAGSTAVGADPRAVTVGDVDGDGDLDLLTGNRNGNSVTVLRNGGAATFVTSTITIAGEVRDVVLGRFDADADLDLAISNQDLRRVELRLNNGAGAFSAGANLTMGQVRPEGLVAADLDGDGDTDLATAGSGGGLNVAVVFVHDGVGGFSGATSFPVAGLDPSALAAADLDVDGDLDLVTANTDSSTLSLLPNAGNASFGAATVLPAGGVPQVLATGDLDGNGGADLAVTREDTGDVAVFFNQDGAPPAFSDLGSALAGSNGLPQLTGTGTLVVGTPWSLELTQARPNTTTYLVVGLTAVNLPFSGGTMVPAFAAPDGAIRIFATDAAGQVLLGGQWIAGVPSGTELYLQHWIVDPAGIFGFAASNAILGVTP
jgi:hypothetical protein